MTHPKKEGGVRIRYDGKDWSFDVGGTELLVHDMELRVDPDNAFNPIAVLHVYVDEVDVVAEPDVHVLKAKQPWWRRLWRTA